MTPDEWDTKWWVIRDDLERQGEPPIAASVIADRECVEQFGSRPGEAS